MRGVEATAVSPTRRDGFPRPDLDERTPRRTLVGLVPEVLVQVRVRDFLEGLDLIHRYEMRIQVHELHADLLERSLSE
jgi:hypothetical protein